MVLIDYLLWHIIEQMVSLLEMDKKYYLRRIDLEKYNFIIDGRNFVILKNIEN